MFKSLAAIMLVLGMNFLGSVSNRINNPSSLIQSNDSPIVYESIGNWGRTPPKK